MRDSNDATTVPRGARAQVGDPLPAPSALRSSNHIVENRYQLQEEIGRGGMGAVYRATDIVLDRDVAIKILRPEVVEVEAAWPLLEREGQALATVQSRAVVGVHTLGLQDGTPYMVMELIDGQRVDDALVSAASMGRLLDYRRAKHIIEGICQGLAAVHEAGVVHRDVKPGNVMVEHGSGRVVLMDFGLGRRCAPEQCSESFTWGGTPAYMAPELFRGEVPTPEMVSRVDIYSAGVMVFELFTGELPFDDLTWWGIALKHAREPRPAPSSRVPGLPKGLDGIVSKAMALEPAERHESAGELLEALRALPASLSEPPLPEPPEAARDDAPRARRTGRKIQAGSRTHVVVAGQDDGFLALLYAAVDGELAGSRFTASRSNRSALELVRKGGGATLLVGRLDDPDLDGVSLARAMQSQRATQQVRLLLTTTSITTAERARLTAQGVCSVIVVPADEAEVRAVIGHMGRCTRDETPCPTARF